MGEAKMNETFVTNSINGINVHICQTNKFKYNLLSVYLKQRLDPCIVTTNSLLASVLRSGTVSYPTQLDLKRRLAELFGAHLSGYVFKRGEDHPLNFSLDIANEEYLPNKDPSLFMNGVAVLRDVLLHPFLEHGSFSNTYINQEKDILRQKIESIRDNKTQFAMQRLIEEMFVGEPYALHPQGRMEDIEMIDSSSLYKYYFDLLRTAPIDIYFIGNHGDALGKLQPLLAELSDYSVKTRYQPAPERQSKLISRVNQKVEKTDIRQAKLDLGFRTGIYYTDDDYPALLLYNGILGAFPHSKLFRTVREEANLAYYISSGLEPHKGLLFIQTGIDPEKYDQALSIIKEQINLMCEGKVSAEELLRTRKGIQNILKEQQDDARSLIDTHYRGVISGRHWSAAQLQKALDLVTIPDIVRVARLISLDTIYLLRN